MRSPYLIQRAKATLLIVDVQERLWPTMAEKEVLLQRTLQLVKGAQILGVPVISTEQYPKGLGKTVAEVAALLKNQSPFEKTSFSACPAVLDSLRQRGVSDVLLCGIESHVCVMQTCLDLLGESFRVFVVADAVASRTVENQRLGVERMRSAGAVIASVEMVLFEMLESAGTAEFKQILEVVK